MEIIKNSKAFRLKKNGQDTNIFKKINENAQDNNEFNLQFNICLPNEDNNN